MKESFIKFNRERIINSSAAITILKLVNVSVLLLVSVILALDIFLNKGFLISGSQLAALKEFDEIAPAAYFVVQLLISFAIAVLPFAWDFFLDAETKTQVILSIIELFSLYCYIYQSFICGSWIYPILLAGNILLMLVLLAVVTVVRKIKVKSTPMTSKQKKQYNEACHADEIAKSENRETREKAQSEWEAGLQQHLQNVQSEIIENIELFNQKKEQIDIHMANLNSMDALCDDDKSLKIVDLLIGFIETHRTDSVKEALLEYDKLMSNQQLLEIEKQRLEAELKRAEQEHSDRMQKLEAERRHQFEMECIARDSAQNRAKAVKELNNIGAMIYYDLHG